MTDVPVTSAADHSHDHDHTHGLVAHHFDDAQQQHDAIELGMWAFLAQEVLFFGGLFLAYLLYRFKYEDAFAEASHKLYLSLGTINTAVLLCSSLTMALAVYSAKIDNKKNLFRYLLLTILLGLVFMGIKGVEWTIDYREHFVPGKFFGFDYSEHLEGRSPEIADHVQMYFFLYFCMTGLHALHMVVGVVILAIIAIKAARNKTSLKDANFVEMMGLYWHFVDIVWIFLFPFLYLIKA